MKRVKHVLVIYDIRREVAQLGESCKGTIMTHSTIWDEYETCETCSGDLRHEKKRQPKCEKVSAF